MKRDGFLSSYGNYPFNFALSSLRPFRGRKAPNLHLNGMISGSTEESVGFSSSHPGEGLRCIKIDSCSLQKQRAVPTHFQGPDRPRASVIWFRGWRSSFAQRKGRMFSEIPPLNRMELPPLSLSSVFKLQISQKR